MRIHIDLPWKNIGGARNILIHAYDHSDPATLIGIVQDDLPVLAKRIQVYLDADVAP